MMIVEFVKLYVDRITGWFKDFFTDLRLRLQIDVYARICRAWENVTGGGQNIIFFWSKWIDFSHSNNISIGSGVVECQFYLW